MSKYNENVGIMICGFSLLGLGLMIFNHITGYTKPIGQNSVICFINSVREVGNHKKDVDNIYNAMLNIGEVSIGEQPPIVVVVIGESYVKRHSSLYNYELKTCPNLEREKEQGNLFVYSDVITPCNGTAWVMELIWSLKSVNDSTEFSRNPLFPAVFRKAGSRVALFDNPFLVSTVNPRFDWNSTYFLNPPKINELCFTYRNNTMSQYDGDFVDEYSSKFLTNSGDVNIIHLNGQHVGAKYRYPNTTEWNKFNSSDILRNDLSESEKQLVAEYDNATYYNDDVLNRIILSFRDKDAVLVYFSDHGEQIYDDSNHMYGRSYGELTPEVIKCQFEIPFMIWCSDEFKVRHPQKANAIKNSIDRPFSIDDVPFVLFDIADVSFKGNKPDRSVINSSYKERDRMLKIGYFYNYDKNKLSIEKAKLLVRQKHNI